MKRRARPREASSSSDAVNADLSKAGLEGGVRPSIQPAGIVGEKYTNFWQHEPSCGLENFLPLHSQSYHAQAHARGFCKDSVSPMASPFSAP